MRNTVGIWQLNDLGETMSVSGVWSSQKKWLFLSWHWLLEWQVLCSQNTPRRWHMVAFKWRHSLPWWPWCLLHAHPKWLVMPALTCCPSAEQDECHVWPLLLHKLLPHPLSQLSTAAQQPTPTFSHVKQSLCTILSDCMGQKFGSAMAYLCSVKTEVLAWDVKAGGMDWNQVAGLLYRLLHSYIWKFDSGRAPAWDLATTAAKGSYTYDLGSKSEFSKTNTEKLQSLHDPAWEVTQHLFFVLYGVKSSGTHPEIRGMAMTL